MGTEKKDKDKKDKDKKDKDKKGGDEGADFAKKEKKTLIGCWSKVKKEVQKVLKKEIKDLRSSISSDDKESFKSLDAKVKAFEKMYKSFDKGLTSELTTVATEKDSKKRIKAGNKALKTIKSYQNILQASEDKINIAKVSMMLSLGLEKVEKLAEKRIQTY